MGGLGSDAKWASDAAARRYAGERFGSARAESRDPRLVGRWLRELGARGPTLDAPCGTGRLRAALESIGAPLVGLDSSLAMLAAARASGVLRPVAGSVECLPFVDRAFEVVVCCRLLHHLRGRAELERAASELVRVSRRYVIASFWDSASLPALRLRLGLKAGEGPRGRRAIPRAEIEGAFERAGARCLGFRATLRFVSQQTFVVAERR